MQLRVEMGFTLQEYTAKPERGKKNRGWKGLRSKSTSSALCKIKQGGKGQPRT